MAAEFRRRKGDTIPLKAIAINAIVGNENVFCEQLPPRRPQQDPKSDSFALFHRPDTADITIRNGRPAFYTLHNILKYNSFVKNIQKYVDVY